MALSFFKMNFEMIPNFFRGKSILVIGTTGFLAKVFVEKILRIQPELKKLYLLVRVSNTDLATHRLQNEVFQTDLFRLLREKWGDNFDSFILEKVMAIAGDVAVENMGLRDEHIKNLLFGEIDIIVNFAATTKFDERFDISMGVNTMGALNVLNFAKNCQRIKVFIHTSTAYVCGEANDEGAIIQEKPFEMGQALNGTSKLDIHAEKYLLEKKIDELRAMNADENTIKFALKDYGIKRANLHGWPNTYVFTKAMGEMLVVHHKDNIPLIIIRPTMVTSTHKDPFPGWIEGVRTLDTLICGYGLGKIACFVCDPKTILDTVPADIVINCMITTIFVHSNQAPKYFIYHVSSSLRNPLKVSDLQIIGFQYFVKTPCMDENGKPIVISKKFRSTSFATFNKYIMIRYVLPLKVSKFMNRMIFNSSKDGYDDKARKIRMIKRLAKLYKPYVVFKAIFDDTNTENLRMVAKNHLNMESAELDFDPTSIDWTNYLMNTHIPGLFKYAVK